MSSSLTFALNIFSSDVDFLYIKNEKNFDLESHHGRFHIIRCLLLADCLHRFYESHSIKIQIEKSYYAIMFHDVMRQGNGIDIWELESARCCYKYLRNKGFDHLVSLNISNIILKKNETNLEEQILYDVDVLDYNRFFYIPEENHLFKDYKLKFSGPNDISQCRNSMARNKIINLAQDLVLFSESFTIETETKQLIKTLSEYYLKIKPW